MYLLPTPPTDNLYKYMALTGLWLCFGVLALIAVLYYQNFESQEFNKQQSWMYSKEDAKRKFESRLDSLSKGRLTENTLKGISDRFTPKEEAVLLEKLRLSTAEEISILKKQTDTPPKTLFPFLSFLPFNEILGVVVSLSWA